MTGSYFHSVPSSESSSSIITVIMVWVSSSGLAWTLTRRRSLGVDVEHGASYTAELTSFSCSRSLVRLFAPRRSADSLPELEALDSDAEWRSSIASHRFRHDGEIPISLATWAIEESDSR